MFVSICCLCSLEFTTSLWLCIVPEIPLKQESDWSRGGAYCLRGRLLDEHFVTHARHGVLFLDPSEAQQQLNEVQRIRGISRRIHVKLFARVANTWSRFQAT